MNTRLIEVIRSAGRPDITVVGDLILDSYVMGEAGRISPEAPIQVLDVKEDRATLGGAANVAANLRALGARVECCGVVGKDSNGDQLIGMLEAAGVGTTAVLRDGSRPTVCKTRVVSRNQQLLRVDREKRTPLGPDETTRLCQRMTPFLKRSAAVVVSDYAKGTLSADILQFVITEAGGFGVLVDPKGADYERYRGARLITPNRREAEQYTGLSLDNVDSLLEAADLLRCGTDVREVVITLGRDGIFHSTSPVNGSVMPARARSVYDVTGAGDTVIAILALFLSTGTALEDAVRIANAGAGIVVMRLGVAAPNRDALIEIFSSRVTRAHDKILSRQEAAIRAEEIRRKGEKVVFTNGCFDLLHGGHLEFLRKAKSLGDCLMVGVNDDDSVRRLKGKVRPILTLEERLDILASLQFVDIATSFSEDDPGILVEEVTPDILVKGEDWRDKGVKGREWVESHGGEVQLIPLKQGRSTSAIIETILDRFGVKRNDSDR